MARSWCKLIDDDGIGGKWIVSAICTVAAAVFGRMVSSGCAVANFVILVHKPPHVRMRNVRPRANGVLVCDVHQCLEGDIVGKGGLE